ncbi:MAG: HNH nuclease [Chloroflexi bacterium OLB14]|nr:MAG: HNH nuclease [Chloroflexi bacterium OLB14]
MPKTPDLTKVKMTFYPMAGSVNSQFENLLTTLSWINSNVPTPNEVYEWLREKYKLSHYFARDIYTVLFISSGLVTIKNGKCILTTSGIVVLQTSSPSILLEVFEKSFAGVAGLLEVLRSNANIKSNELINIWFELVKHRFPKMQGWSRKTLGNQSRHRIDWLRTMGFIKVENGLHSLTESGWIFVLQHPPELIAIQKHEINKQEKIITKVIQDSFQPFDSSEKILTLRQSVARDRAFRTIVVSQYDYFCAVCNLKLSNTSGSYLAEAAHIIPKSNQGSDDPRNGICLCRNCHWAFDEGIISVKSESRTILTASYLKKAEPRKTPQSYIKFNGKKIRNANDSNFSPSNIALEWHNEKIFLG